MAVISIRLVEEEIKNGQHTMKRKSTASSSVANVITVFCREFNVDIRDYDVHINFSGGVPVDGPSAGVAIFSALYSAVKQIIMPPDIAMTGEVSICGRVLPVGGVPMKIEGAIEAGAKRVIIPKENYQTNFSSMNIEILCVSNLDEVLAICFGEASEVILTA
ncbi:Lon protease 2 [bioreactor metagenome]|uniref:Lon protease 2 n=1 Tax=bioreactor metagenome TaxID=1076179 RepID=A0A645IT93_9ZZZZ